MKTKKDLTGQKFGRLEVIKYLNDNYWLCQCECGKITKVKSYNLTSNHTKSCGCLKNKAYNYSHKQSKTRLYDIWIGIKTRCNNKNSKSYKNYGGRGIKVCDEWLKDFLNFYDWAINNGYQEDLTIDRIDINGNYEPSNCRWADKITQANNTSRNKFINYNGENHTIAEWARKLNKNYKNLHKKIKKGLPFEKAINIV